MKKLLIILFALVVSGCYLANGSPPASMYWIKNGMSISYEHANYCYEKSKIDALNKKELDKFLYLDNKFRANLLQPQKNSRERTL